MCDVKFSIYCKLFPVPRTIMENFEKIMFERFFVTSKYILSLKKNHYSLKFVL